MASRRRPGSAGIGERRGIVRGALFFALVHVLTISGNTAGEAFQLALIGFATRIPVALALGYLFVRGYSIDVPGLGRITALAGSIWVPFGLHAAFNGILLILAEAAARAGVPGRLMRPGGGPGEPPVSAAR